MRYLRWKFQSEIMQNGNAWYTSVRDDIDAGLVCNG